MTSMTIVPRNGRGGNRRTARRGVALMLVLGVVAVGSILGWAMLSSASLRAQLDSNVNDSIESKYLADSGISYAMYYLRYPSKSPVALTTGTYNKHYGGESNLQLWSDANGKVSITVTNPAQDTFLIRSSSLVNGTVQTAEAEVKLLMTGYIVNSALASGGSLQVPSNVTVSGLVKTVSTVLDAVGNVLSVLGGSSITVDADAVPGFSQLSLYTETGVTASTGGNDRTYKYNGQTYVAELAPATITGTLSTSRPALNPGNVWYSESDVTLNGATINGTLILRHSGKSVTLKGTNTVTAKITTLPAVVVGKDMIFSHASLTPAKLTATGVVYVGKELKNSGSTLLAKGVTINGSLMLGDAAPKIDASIGPISLTFNAAASSVKLKPDDVISGITVNRWDRR